MMATAASRVPAALGVNVTLMAQLAPGTSGTGQLYVTANSEAFTPVTFMLLIFRLALPVLVKTTV